MKVGIINVPSKVGPTAWQECWEAVATRAGIFGINETFLRAAKDLYLDLAHEHGYGQYGVRRSPNPIFWDRARWRRVPDTGRVHTLHGRGTRYARWPGFNDARYVTEVVLRRRGRPNAREVAVLCTHWVPEGRKVTSLWRAWARRQSKAVVRRLLLEHLAAGRIVYLLGDTNIAAPFDLDVPGFRWIRGSGIDKVGVAVPDDMKVEDDAFELFPAPTDHQHGVVTRARLRARAVA